MAAGIGTTTGPGAERTGAEVDRAGLIGRYRRVRARTEALCEPLSPEDMVVQVEACASPAKWHLGHTTWFFETFLLERFEPGFARHSEAFNVLFNSYYHSVGRQWRRDRRGLLTRPGVAQVLEYRRAVDRRVEDVLSSLDASALAEAADVVVLGLEHERQHQELLLTDIKLLLGASPLAPAYRDDPWPEGPREAGPMGWAACAGGVREIGHAGAGFAYDNERPRHERVVPAHAMADRLVTNAEYLAFVEDGGYSDPLLWLDDGWKAVQSHGWEHPLYWRRDGEGRRWEFTLRGLVPLDADAPVVHVSFFEADAFARWSGARLPTEAEWEVWGSGAEVVGNFVESDRLHPAPAGAQREGVAQLFGDVWEWTRSAHEPYPGYAPPAGAVGEYNGKFMCGTFVLRGGSCATARDHVRATYRNFFAPDARWQFSGIRLARDAC